MISSNITTCTIAICKFWSSGRLGGGVKSTEWCRTSHCNTRNSVPRCRLNRREHPRHGLWMVATHREYGGHPRKHLLRNDSLHIFHGNRWMEDSLPFSRAHKRCTWHSSPTFSRFADKTKTKSTTNMPFWSELKEVLLEAKSVIQIPSFQIIVAQGVAGAFPWSGLFSFAPMWLELVGFSHETTAFLITMYVIGNSIGGLFGG